jgi:hypothetical protein
MSKSRPLPTDDEGRKRQLIVDAMTTDRDRREVNRLVRSLRALNLKHTDFEYLKGMLPPLLQGYPISTATTDVHEPFFRAVPWPEKPTKINQLGCPPHESVRLGRANAAGNPVFYASAGCHSTVMELAPNLNDQLAISKWRTKANLTFICAGYTANAFGHGEGFKRIESLPWVRQRAAAPLFQKPGNQLIHEFISHEFTKRVQRNETWNYKISAAFSQSLLNAKSFKTDGAPTIEIAGIAYPSFPNEGNADNVALKSEIAAEYLEFVCVQYIRIARKTDGSQYSMIGLDFADSLSADGTIEWQTAFPSDRIAGTDHTFRPFLDRIEILDNKGVVVGTLPLTQVSAITGLES